MRRPVKRARAKSRPGANPSPPQMPSAKAPPAGTPGDGIPTQRGTVIQHDPKVELVQRRIWVLNLARAGMSLSRIIDAAPQREPIPLDASEVRRIYSDYLAELKVQYAAEIPTARAAQLERLFGDLSRARGGDVVLFQGTPVPNVRKVNYAAIARLEHEVALILGTHAPKVIEVNTDDNFAHAMTRLLQGMGTEEYERLADEAARLEAGAQVRH